MCKDEKQRSPSLAEMTIEILIYKSMNSLIHFLQIQAPLLHLELPSA
jgi:hypothetical protein